MADVNRKFVEAAYQDVEATFAAIDKLAGAPSLTEAYEVYVGICASRHVRTAGRVSIFDPGRRLGLSQGTVGLRLAAAPRSFMSASE